jgi:hypothetical protein
MDRLVLSNPEVDAFVVVDADSVADAHLLSELAAAHAAGAKVAQADYQALLEGDDARSQLRAAAFLLFHRARFKGKARLGLPCSLVGNGMLIGRDVAQRHPWSGFSEVEDLEYTLQLRLSGVGPVFVPGGHLVAPVASSGGAAEVQRARWEGGRLRISAEYLPRVVRTMVRERRPDLWDVAADLAVPPLGVLAGGVAVGTGVALTLRATGRASDADLVAWLFACVALPFHVLVGLRAADAPPAVLKSLTSTPGFLVSELDMRARVVRSGGARTWVRTPRTSHSAGTEGRRGSAD